MPQIQQLRYTSIREERLRRVAAYCRVSSDSEDQLNSYAAQIQFYTEYIGQQPDWELVDIYADEGLTGTKTDKREDLKRLVNDCRKGKIDKVIVKSVSRFARNTYDSIYLTRQLKTYGTGVYFEEQRIDTTDMNDEMMLSMQSMAAQNESVNISKNVRWSYDDRMQRGEFVGTVSAYGYNLINGTLEINEAEAVIVHRIFDMFLSGMGKQAIANALNAESVPRRHGKDKWYSKAINYILTNERYIGDALLRKNYTTEFPFKKMKNKGELQQYYIENNHQPLISREIFDVVQQRIEKSNKHPRTNKRHTLTGRLICPDCGGNFRRIMINDIAYWGCAPQITGSAKCQPRRYLEESIYNAFLLLVNKLTINREYILKPLIGQLERMQSRNSSTQKNIYEIDRQIAALNDKNHLIAKFRSKGEIDAADFAADSGAINNRVNTLRAQRRKLLAEDENDEMIDGLKTLDTVIAGLDVVQIEFDESLFAEIVTNITAVSNTELRFRLIGGLELTEIILRKERRSTT